MSSPHVSKRQRDREDTLIVASAFVLVAIAIGGLFYAYSSPQKQIQAASNQPTLIETTGSGNASQ
jgi:hypothetical protein